jgi:hypothetical protein
VFVPRGIFVKVEDDIVQLCDDALKPQIFDWVTDAERNQPYISGSGRDAFGRLISSKLVVSEGWRKLQDVGFEKG